MMISGKGVKPKLIMPKDESLKNLPYAEAVKKINENIEKVKLGKQMLEMDSSELAEFKAFKASKGEKVDADKKENNIANKAGKKEVKSPRE
jgi:hypothetical protein